MLSGALLLAADATVINSYSSVIGYANRPGWYFVKFALQLAGWALLGVAAVLAARSLPPSSWADHRTTLALVLVTAIAALGAVVEVGLGLNQFIDPGLSQIQVWLNLSYAQAGFAAATACAATTACVLGCQHARRNGVDAARWTRPWTLVATGAAALACGSIALLVNAVWLTGLPTGVTYCTLAAQATGWVVIAVGLVAFGVVATSSTRGAVAPLGSPRRGRSHSLPAPCSGSSGSKRGTSLLAVPRRRRPIGSLVGWLCVSAAAAAATVQQRRHVQVDVDLVAADITAVPGIVSRRERPSPQRAAARCRATSKQATAPATAALSEAIEPRCGIATTSSHLVRASRLRPFSSPPMTSATGTSRRSRS